MGNISIYLPEDAQSKEILKRVKVKQDAYQKTFGKKISFSEIVMQGLTLLVRVGSNGKNIK